MSYAMLQAGPCFLTEKSSTATSSFPSTAARRASCLINLFNLARGPPRLSRLGRNDFDSTSEVVVKTLPRASRSIHSDQSKVYTPPSEGCGCVPFQSAIKELLSAADDVFCFSAYDMGWIARIPHHGKSNAPQFPQSVEWIIANQCEDGSWDGDEELPQRNCSTLICVIALKTWNQGNHNIQKGLDFLKSQLPSIQERLPPDMKVVLSKLLTQAQKLNLKLDFDHHIHEGGQAFLEGSNFAVEQYPTSFVHILEALDVERTQWQRLLVQFQSSNGLIFSTTLTACAYMQTRDRKCLSYIQTLLSDNTEPDRHRYGSHYYYGILQKVRLVYWLEQLGIERYFAKEIDHALVQAFRLWRGNFTKNGNQLHLEKIEDCAFLFRVLRSHGYEVSPGVLLEKAGEARDLEELDLASQFYFPAESKMIPAMCVEHKETSSSLLSLPWYGIMNRIWHIENIAKFTNERPLVKFLQFPQFPLRFYEQYAAILDFAKSDFNSCQKIYQKDLQHVIRWKEKCKFGSLKFARQTDVSSIFMAASTFFEPELSMARIVSAKMSVLITVFDDYMDTHTSLESLKNFCTAVTRWDASGLDLEEDASILLQGLFDTVQWVAQSALPLQGTDISDVLRAQWRRLCNAILREAEWRLTNQCPSLGEYMENGITTFAAEPMMLAPIFFLDEKIDPMILDHPDTINMYRRTSTIGRLLNDIRGFDRENAEGKLSWIPIYLKEHPDASMDDAVSEMRKMVTATREELVEDIFRPRALPRKCKRVFENMLRIMNFIYHWEDGFTYTQGLKHHIARLLYKSLA